MEDNNRIKFTREHVLKLALPLIILIVIGFIWVIKNTERISVSDKGMSLDAADVEAIADFDLHVSEEIDLNQLKSYGIPIIIDFGADTCEPCKAMAPALENLNGELKGKAIIRFVDVRKYPELAEGFPINLIPTQVFFDKDGKPFVPSDPQNMQMTMYSLRETGEHVFTVHEGGMTEEMLLSALKEMGLKE